MERVGAADGVGHVLLHVVIDPKGSVAADGLDAGAVLLGELLEDLGEDLLAVAFMYLGDGVGVMVDDYRDVLMPLVQNP